MLIKGYQVDKKANGYYEIPTPQGVHTIDRNEDNGRWMHTPAGEFSPSGDFRILKEAVVYVYTHFVIENTRPISDAYAANTAAANAVLSTVDFGEFDAPEDGTPIVARVSFAPADLERLKAKDDADRVAWRSEMDARKAREREMFG